MQQVERKVRNGREKINTTEKMERKKNLGKAIKKEKEKEKRKEKENKSLSSVN
jgi:hypothetical protein